MLTREGEAAVQDVAGKVRAQAEALAELHVRLTKAVATVEADPDAVPGDVKSLLCTLISLYNSVQPIVAFILPLFGVTFPLPVIPVPSFCTTG